jgi:carboxymethylenebutenolidase
MKAGELRSRLTSMPRIVGALALVGVAIALWIASRSPVERSSDGEFGFDAQSIGEFHCAPGAGRHPAVILLHGAGYRGLGHDDFEAMCSALADRGYYAEFIEYLDAGGNSDPTTDAMDNFRTWTTAIHAGITSLARNPAIDPKHIAVMGFSQGAYLATGCGAMFPNDVAAVVEYYGGLVPTLRDKAKSMPPTLIIHGEADTIIPVSEAKELNALLSKAGRTHEAHLYPRVEHGFNFHIASVGYDREASEDAWHRTLEFLDRTLRTLSVPPSTSGEAARG